MNTPPANAKRNQVDVKPPWHDIISLPLDPYNNRAAFVVFSSSSDRDKVILRPSCPDADVIFVSNVCCASSCW